MRAWRCKARGQKNGQCCARSWARKNLPTIRILAAKKHSMAGKSSPPAALGRGLVVICCEKNVGAGAAQATEHVVPVKRKDLRKDC